MSWYDEDYRKRRALTVINASGGSPIDANITIPKDDDDFWETIDANGEGIRITLADGFTLATYDIDDGAGGAFDKTGRNGRVRVDGMATNGQANAALLLWAYYGVETPTDGSSAVTITSAETGHWAIGSPSWASIAVTRPRPEIERPEAIVHKDSTEVYHVWLDLAPVLEVRDEVYAKRLHYEEPLVVSYTIVNNAGSEQAGMLNRAAVRFVELVKPGGRARKLFLRIPVQAGSSGTKYTARTSISTHVPPNTFHRTIRHAFTVAVRDLLEP